MTERNYVDDLMMVARVFRQPLAKILTEQEVQVAHLLSTFPLTNLHARVNRSIADHVRQLGRADTNRPGPVQRHAC